MPARFLLIFAFAALLYGQQNEFRERCAGCHGADGTGGGHGPAIVGLKQFRAVTADQIREVILRGIPGSGMPAFPLDSEQAGRLAEFVLSLRAPRATAAERAKSGDPAAGQRFFYGEGDCKTCHMVSGTGGLLGPDLSNLGKTRGSAELEQAFLAPAPVKIISVRLRGGGPVLRGIARSESAFELQLMGDDNRLHLLVKTDILRITREPAVSPHAGILAGDRRDLIAYLGLNHAGAGPAGDFGEIIRPKPTEWPTYDGSHTGNRFSPLQQIDPSNVNLLAPAWIFTLPGSPGHLQTTPVVKDGVMYVTAANQVWAVDARGGREVWHFTRPRTPGLAGDAAGGINRGVALLGDRVFFETDNAHLLALHRLTGQLLWETEMAEASKNYGATGAPLVVNDLVIAGVSGGDEGIRGFLDAYKASTGERVWRFWTVPAPGEPGSETWRGTAWEHGCGATWLTGTYDLAANLLYWPVGNPCPDYNGTERAGDNLYTSSVIALEPATGKLRWHYQFTPHDLHDWDATETPVLVDAVFRGEPRKLLLQGNRNGFFYVLDRLTGKVLLAQPFVKQLTWASGIGPDGRPVLLPGNEPTADGQVVCPSVAGAANWPSSAFSPQTGLYYLFAEESCSVYSKKDDVWKAGESFYGGDTKRAPGQNGGKFLKAIDIQTGKAKWEIPDVGGGILGSGLLVTAGGLVFYGDGHGAFIAADARTGKLLWHFNAGQTWKAGPMTYTVDNQQYIGIAAGSTILSFTLR